MSVFDYRNTDVFDLSDVSGGAKSLDLLWMMSHAFDDTDRTPMWIGFNAIGYQDHLPKQEVRYMPNLCHPITSLDVIHETLVTAQKCALECEQQYAVVSYDLNAAKPAMQIQVAEIPKFDNVFIMPGTFHIEMALFKAIGKIISDSGGPDMLAHRHGCSCTRIIERVPFWQTLQPMQTATPNICPCIRNSPFQGIPEDLHR